MGATPTPVANQRLLLAFAAGAGVGVLGGMVGLGGAEFRLPLLISFFGLVALQAVILNKAMSLVVVAVALQARLGAVPYADVAPDLSVVANLLAGSLVGAWLARRLLIAASGPGRAVRRRGAGCPLARHGRSRRRVP